MTSLDANPDAPPSPVTIEDVRGAASTIEGVAHRTPVLTSRAIDRACGGEVSFKCENFQRVGAFKFRGAFNALSRLSEEQRRRGVLTYSSGNHAQAVALAGKLLGVHTTIVMPSDAPRVKLDATRGYQGDEGEVVEYGREETTREELGARLASERGLTIIPPYDHPDVIAGQGTVALELVDQTAANGPLDELYVCTGGGGLLSGCSIVSKALMPGCTVIGVEPEAADDATRSFRTGVLQSVHNPETIADGARTPSLGRWTFPLIRQHVDEMMTVSDAELLTAMRLVYERLKIVIEPTGALALAGLLQRGPRGGERVGVVVSGGNVALERLGTFFSAK